MEIKTIGGIGAGQGLGLGLTKSQPVSAIDGAGKFFSELVSKVNDM